MSFGMIWCDGFDHYGGDSSHMLDGAWSATSCTIKTDGSARTGSGYMVIGSSQNSPTVRSLGPDYTDLYVGFGFRVPSLPSATANDAALATFQDSGGSPIASVVLMPTGRLAVMDGNHSATTLYTTSTQVIQTGTWQYVEIHWVKQNTGGDGKIQVQVDAVTVIDQSAVTWTNANAAGIMSFGEGGTVLAGAIERWFDDIVIRDGTVTAAFVGDLRVATLYPDADQVTGFTPRYRKRFGNGILDTTANSNSGIWPAASTLDDLGSADYTLETWVRFTALPTVANKAHIFGKWSESDNQRSYQLYLGGPSLDNGQLCFRISTDGQAGTVNQLILWPWTPDLDRWYYIALSRASGTTRLFIGNEDDANSIMQIAVADANTYYAAGASALFTIGAQGDGTANLLGNTGVDGYFDEVRSTPGIGRYTASFATMTQAFPRSVGAGDADFASVAFLAGFDNSVADESGNGRATSVYQGAAQLTADDGTGQYTTLDQDGPRDDTFVEASLIAATGTFLLTANPSDGETVTVGTKAASTPAVYTLKTAIAAAFDVLIGATIQDTIDNLAAAIIQGVGEGTTYGTGTTANLDVSSTAEQGGQVLVTALTAGSTGNSIATSTTAVAGSWEQGTGTTLSGGQDIPGPSEFTFDRLPINTTVIKAIQIVSRSFKTDSGTCDYRVSFIGPSGTVAGGADRSLGVNPAYYNDIFEEDPDTAAAITPTTLISGRVRLERIS